MTTPEYGTEDYRRHAVLFNDITYAPLSGRGHLIFSDRLALTNWLWEQGWRRDVRPEDVTEPAHKGRSIAERMGIADEVREIRERAERKMSTLPDGV